MHYSKFLIMAVLLCAFATGRTQSTARQYTGDQLTDLELGTLLTAAGDTRNVKLSDYAGKLVILDFWNTHCGPCVKALPKMDSLQKKFGERIAILPVTYESKGLVQRFLSRQQAKGINLELPSIINDTTLSKRFPHISVPHEVWIGPDGKVIAQTKEFVVTTFNIAKVLAGNTSAIADREPFTGFDARRNVFLNQGSHPDSSVLFQRLITGAVSEGNTGGVGNGLVAGGKAFRFYAWNQTAQLLYLLAYNLASLSQINWNAVPDPGRYFLPDSIDYYKNPIGYSQWAARNQYCYELILPIPDSLRGSDPNRIRKVLTPVFSTYLQQDLAMFFKLDAAFELQEVTSLVLEGEITGNDPDGRVYSANTITATLNRTYGSDNNMPVVNEVQFPEKKARIVLSAAAFQNYDRLREDLKKAGLTLSKQIRKIPVLTLSPAR